MEDLKVILLSVFSGVITTVFLYIVSLLIKNVISPWYQRFTYKGVDVSGEWEGTHIYSDKCRFIATLNLKQNAHDLTGTFTVIKVVNEKHEDITEMKAIGEVWEGFVSLKCRTISNKKLSFGSMLCKVGGSSLNGKYIFRNIANDSSISGLDFNFNRKNA